MNLFHFIFKPYQGCFFFQNYIQYTFSMPDHNGQFQYQSTIKHILHYKNLLQ